MQQVAQGHSRRPFAKKLQDLRTQERNLFAERGKLLLFGWLQKAVVVAIHQYLQMPIRLHGEAELTDGLDPRGWS